MNILVGLVDITTQFWLAILLFIDHVDCLKMAQIRINNRKLYQRETIYENFVIFAKLVIKKVKRVK